MVRLLPAVLVLGAAIAARGAELRVFGSAGGEGRLTPASSASPLNPGNVLGLPYRSASSDVTTFIEAVPATNRWKAHLKLRASGDGADGDVRGRFRVGEAFLQTHLAGWLDVAVGRRIEKWGTGYAWNPTGFVNPRKDPADAGDRLKARTGADLVRADVFVRDVNVSLYLLPRFGWDTDEVSGRGRPDFAARAYRLVAGTDVSVMYRRDGQQARSDSAGLSVARTFGDAVELHAEAATLEREGGRRYTEALVGGQYTFANGLNVIAELFHGGSGLTAGQWSAFRDDVAVARSRWATGDVRPLLAANARYAPLQMARDYSFVRVSRAWPRRGGVELLAITNLRDGSTIARGTVSRELRANLQVYLLQTELLGNAGSELGYAQIERQTNFGFRLHY
ncbi:MAG TPA: hypothetical protein VEO54_14860 [Thermoanaerobaculia bacterium]|nr:hypothetical protein [Thermoanaerobaculia bacterium]